MDKKTFITKAAERGLAKPDIISAMNDYRVKVGAFDDDEPVVSATPPDTTIPPPMADTVSTPPMADTVSTPPAAEPPPANRVWSEFGGVLPNPKQLAEFFKTGIRNLKDDPRKTLFPMADAILESGDPGLINTLKANGAAVLDALGWVDRAANFATGNVFAEGAQAAKRAIPGEGLPSDIARMGVDVAAAPSNVVGGGLIKSAVAPIAKQTSAEIARTAAGPVSRAVKTGVAQGVRIPQNLIQEVADNPATLERLKQAAISDGDGGFVDLVESVQRTINSENANTKAQAMQRISDIVKKATEQTEGEIASAMADITGALGKNADLVDRSATGSAVVESVAAGKKAISDTYGSGAVENIDKMGGLALPAKPVGVVGGKMQIESPLQENIKAVISKSGAVGDEYTMLESFGGSRVMPGDLDDARMLLDKSKHAQSVKDVIGQLKTIRSMFGKKSPDGRFYNSKMLAEIEGAYHKTVEDAITAAGPDAQGLLDLYRADTKRYREGITALTNIEEGLNLKNASSEAVISKIKSMGYDRLRQIEQTAKSNPDIAPVWGVLKDGFLDDVVSAASDASGNVDAAKLRKIWYGIDKNDVNGKIRSLMLGTKKADDIDAALQQAGRAEAAGKARKESTSEIVKTIRTAAKGKEAPSESAIRNIGSKGTESAVEALETLKTLDTFYGTDLASKAMDFWKSRKIGIDAGGNVPYIPTDANGRTVLGIAIAKSAGLIDKIPGIGPLLSTAIGLTGTSPAGAISAYRALDKLAKAKAMVTPKSVTGAALVTKPQLFAEEEE